MTLYDTFSVTGTDFNTFCKELQELSDHTKELVLYGGQITFLSLCELPEAQAEGKWTFYVLDREYIDDFLRRGCNLPYGRIPKSEAPTGLIKELRSTTKFAAMTQIDGEKAFFLVSDIAIPTITLRAGVGGNTTINRQNLIRNIHLTDAILSRNDEVHIVYREDTVDEIPVKKIFSTFGQRYTLYPQSVISSAIQSLINSGEGYSISSWSIDHCLTRIYLRLEVPGVASLSVAPGFCIFTSDVGKSSLTIYSIISFPDGSYIIIDEKSIRHASRTWCPSPDDVIESVKSLTPGIQDFLRSLKKLRKVSVTIDDMKSLIEKTARRLMKKGSNWILAGKRTASMIQDMWSAIDEKEHTLYDTALLLFSMPGRIEDLDDSNIDMIRKNFARVPECLLHP